MPDTCCCRKKGAHGSGVDLNFPSKHDIDIAMTSHPDDYWHGVYGDASLTTPKTWWAALGGMGAWIPDWNWHNEDIQSKKEFDIAEPGLGPVGSSTRYELAAWIITMAEPIRTIYASDSASMVSKACQLINLAKKLEGTKKVAKK